MVDAFVRPLQEPNAGYEIKIYGKIEKVCAYIERAKKLSEKDEEMASMIERAKKLSAKKAILDRVSESRLATIGEAAASIEIDNSEPLRILLRKCAHKSHMVTVMAFMDYALWAAQAAIYVSERTQAVIPDDHKQIHIHIPFADEIERLQDKVAGIS